MCWLTDAGAQKHINKRTTFQAQASCNALFTHLADDKRIDNNAAFVGATVVQAAGYLDKSSVPGSLLSMGVDGKALSRAAFEIIAEYSEVHES